MKKKYLILICILSLFKSFAQAQLVYQEDSINEESTFSILIDGGLRDIGSEVSNKQAATGLLGFDYYNDRLETNLAFVLGSNTTTITEVNNGFGGALLNPNISSPQKGFQFEITNKFLFNKKGYGKFLLNRNRHQISLNTPKYKAQLQRFGLYNKNYIQNHLGVRFYVRSNQTDWTIKDSVSKNITESMGIFSIGLNAIFTHYLFLKSRNINSTNLNFNSDLIIEYGVGITARQLFGEASSNKYFLEHSIGIEKKTFLGLEFMARFKYSNLYAELSLPVFGGDIKGFSSGYLIINIGVSAKIGGEWKKRNYFDDAIDPITKQSPNPN